MAQFNIENQLFITLATSKRNRVSLRFPDGLALSLSPDDADRLASGLATEASKARGRAKAEKDRGHHPIEANRDTIDYLSKENEAIVGAAIFDGVKPILSDGNWINTPVWFLGCVSYPTREQAIAALIERARKKMGDNGEEQKTP